MYIGAGAIKPLQMRRSILFAFALLLAGRAFVTRARKLWLVAGCALRALASAPARLFRLLRGASSETPALAAPGWSDDFLRP